jgi:hypothetical protein
MRPWKIILIVVGTIVVLFTALVFPRVWPVMKIMREMRQYPSETEAKTALTRNPDDAMAHYTLAKAAHNRNDRNTLLAELEIAHRLEPTNEWYKMDLSIALRIAGRDAEAVPLLKSITNPRLVPEANFILQRISQATAKSPSKAKTPIPR